MAEPIQDLPETNTPEEEQLIDASSNETIADFLGESEADEVVEDEVVEDEPQEETPLEADTAPEEIEEEPEIPVQEVAEEVRRDEREKVKAELLQALGVTEQQKQDMEEAGWKAPWEARGENAPKDWKEVLEAAVDLQDFKREEEQRRLEEINKETLAEIQEQTKLANREWDSQLDYLRETGAIPEIAPAIKQKIESGKTLTLEERKDPGLVAQAQIFQTMYDTALEREEAGLLPITDVVHIYDRYVAKSSGGTRKAGTKPAGASSPVSGGRKAVTQQNNEDFGYDEIKDATFEDLLGI